VWFGSVSSQAGAVRCKFTAARPEKANPANAALNVYSRFGWHLFFLIVTPDNLPPCESNWPRGPPDVIALLRSGKSEAQNLSHCCAFLRRGLFGSAANVAWYEVFAGPHVTFGAVLEPLRKSHRSTAASEYHRGSAEGSGGKLTSTDQQCPFRVAWRPPRFSNCAPGLGEHNDEILNQLGFSANRKSTTCNASGFVSKEKSMRSARRNKFPPARASKSSACDRHRAAMPSRVSRSNCKRERKIMAELHGRQI